MFFLRTLEAYRVLGSPIPDCAAFLCLGQVSSLLWQNKTQISYLGEFYANRMSDGMQFQSARCILPIEVFSHIKDQRFNVLITAYYISGKLSYTIKDSKKLVDENAPHVMRIMKIE